MILYQSVFVKIDASRDEYDLNTNVFYWFVVIITCILKWVFSFMYLFKEDGSPAMGVILLVLPLLRLSVIGVRNFSDICGKFYNNAIRLCMFLLITLESFVEVPANYFCIQHLYYYSNYFRIYDQRTWIRTANIIFQMIEYLLITIFTIVYFTFDKKNSFIVIPVLTIIFASILLFFNMFLLIIDILISSNSTNIKGIDKLNKVFSGQKVIGELNESDSMYYFNHVYRNLSIEMNEMPDSSIRVNKENEDKGEEGIKVENYSQVGSHSRASTLENKDSKEWREGKNMKGGSKNIESKRNYRQGSNEELKNKVSVNTDVEALIRRIRSHDKRRENEERSGKEVDYVEVLDYNSHNNNNLSHMSHNDKETNERGVNINVNVKNYESGNSNNNSTNSQRNFVGEDNNNIKIVENEDLNEELNEEIVNTKKERKYS